MLDRIRRVLQSDPSLASDPSRLYTRSMAALVDGLLSRGRKTEEHSSSGVERRPLEQPAQVPLPVPSMTPEEVGQAYEYLRGLRVHIGPEEGPKLLPSVRGKRNQGLFYTPPSIVRFIVKAALDRLGIINPEDHLDLKVLDPAVGAGVFLVEALDQITNRVLVPGWSRKTHLSRRICDIVAQTRARLLHRAPSRGLNADVAVRIYVLENCLYGVDLDPIAVAIARKALIAKACGHPACFPDIGLRIRVGNSLIGEGNSNLDSACQNKLDRGHAKAFFGRGSPDSYDVGQWSKRTRAFHWPVEYPEVFGREPRGFDAIIGNPPYEIVSVKESGLRERAAEQRYFRQVYGACRGKINTYRLMLERGLNLLTNHGTLGFILPATLLADSTADALRRMVLEHAEVSHAVVIPEKAGIFQNVTQALLILVLKKGRTTSKMHPVFWNGKGNIPESGAVEIPGTLIEATNFRIPLLRSEDEKRLLEAISAHPPLKGTADLAPLAHVHQGEINLSVHRRFITARPTAFPLIRGEHVMQFRVSHPSSRPGRLDWILPEYASDCMERTSSLPGVSCATGKMPRSVVRERPWAKDRIVLGRVVNMATSRRLKAAVVPSGVFLGDMTNFIADAAVPKNYLLGLLNSRLLNWRLKITSTNNYLSAAEIESLPIPRIPRRKGASTALRSAQMNLRSLMNEANASLTTCLEVVKALFGADIRPREDTLISEIIQWLVEEILRSGNESRAPNTALTNLVDAMVLRLYGIALRPELVGILGST